MEEKEREYCEVVPGPAICLTKEEYERIKNAKVDPEMRKRNQKNFNKIKGHINNKCKDDLVR